MSDVAPQTDHRQAMHPSMVYLHSFYDRRILVKNAHFLLQTIEQRLKSAEGNSARSFSKVISRSHSNHLPTHTLIHMVLSPRPSCFSHTTSNSCGDEGIQPMQVSCNSHALIATLVCINKSEYSTTTIEEPVNTSLIDISSLRTNCSSDSQSQDNMHCIQRKYDRKHITNLAQQFAPQQGCKFPTSPYPPLQNPFQTLTSCSILTFVGLVEND